METTLAKPANGRLAVADVPTIETILMTAVERGMDPAGLEKLVALSERMADRRAAAALGEAMGQFQSKCPRLLKTSEASFKTKAKDGREGRQVNYNYMELGDMLREIGPAMTECGLSARWEAQQGDGKVKVTCIVTHTEGGSCQASFVAPVPSDGLANAVQQIGIATTYGRRYSLQFALGICTEADDDGHGAGKAGQQQPAKPATAQPSKQTFAAFRNALNAAMEDRTYDKADKQAVVKAIVKRWNRSKLEELSHPERLAVLEWVRAGQADEFRVTQEA